MAAPDLSIPCFLAGTSIATPCGAAAVETLRAGMQVLTAAGAARAIIWVGHRRIDLHRHPDPASVQPVRVARGAFGPGQPQRDLLLSPDHAIWHLGALIPVHLLVNGSSVRQQALGVARYTHVELASHDILLAEGLPVESFLDTGNRCLLGRATHAPSAAHSGSSQAQRCAPLVLGGPMLARVRRHLLVCQPRGPSAAAAAAASRHNLTVRLEARELAPVRRIDRRWWYLLPPHATTLRLETHQPGAIAGAMLDGTLLDLAGPAFADGFAAPVTNGRRSIRPLHGIARLDLPTARDLPAGKPRHHSLELILA